MNTNACTVKVRVYIYQLDFGNGRPEFVAFTTDAMSDAYYTLVGPAEFTYIVPDDWNPIAAKVSLLEKQRDEVKKAFTDKLAEINRKLSELQAITYQTEAA